MKTILALLILIVMSPAGQNAFGQIVGAQITSGIYDIQENGQAIIEAVGHQRGVLTKFRCLWVGGRPVWITKWVIQGET